MPRTIAGFDPVSRVRGLLVEVHGRPSAAIPVLLDPLKRRLYHRNLRVGLLVTPTWTYVVGTSRRGRLTATTDSPSTSRSRPRCSFNASASRDPRTTTRG